MLKRIKVAFFVFLSFLLFAGCSSAPTCDGVHHTYEKNKCIVCHYEAKNFLQFDISYKESLANELLKYAPCLSTEYDLALAQGEYLLCAIDVATCEEDLDKKEKIYREADTVLFEVAYEEVRAARETYDNKRKSLNEAKTKVKLYGEGYAWALTINEIKSSTSTNTTIYNAFKKAIKKYKEWTSENIVLWERQIIEIIYDVSGIRLDY